MNRLQKSVQIEQPALSLVGQRGWSIAPPARKKWFGSLPGPVVGIRDLNRTGSGGGSIAWKGWRNVTEPGVPEAVPA
jgi:hypothetical protein